MTEWHTEYFRSLEEVEYVFDIRLWGQQETLILEYLRYGIVPENDGCWSCDAGKMRILIAKIRDYETDLKNGDATWPWSSIQSPSSELIRVQPLVSRSTPWQDPTRLPDFPMYSS